MHLPRLASPFEAAHPSPAQCSGWTVASEKPQRVKHPGGLRMQGSRVLIELGWGCSFSLELGVHLDI